MSLNYFLLSNFTENASAGSDIVSIQKRYRSLSLIYLNLFQILLCTIYKSYGLTYSPLPSENVAMFSIPLLVLSLVLLKKGKDDMAVCLILAIYHIGITICSLLCDTAIGGFANISFLPSVGFLITKSSVIHALNFVCCVTESGLYIRKINTTFSVTLTAEQEREIIGGQAFLLCALATQWVHNYLTKHLEAQLMQHVDVNQEKATNITEELVQALSTQNIFVSCLSHEIRNPLNFLNTSINHLIKNVKDASCTETLRNARLSCEVLLNLVSTLIDAAKIKSEKIKREDVKVDPIDIVKKALTLNTESLKDNKVSAKVHIYNNLPSLVWIDSDRFLQVITNLMANAIRSTKNKEIKLYMDWVPISSRVEALSKPVELHPFDMNIEFRRPNRMNTVPTVINLPEESSDLNTDIGDDLSTELNPQEAINHHPKMKYLKGILTKSLKQVIGNKTILHDDLQPWIIIRKDHLANLVIQNIRTKSSSAFSPIPSEKEGFIKFQVSDDGVIPNVVLQRVSDMFTHNDTSNVIGDHGGIGFGLSLWISKRLCELMGGDISVYSKEHEGTTVVFYIPVKIGSLVEPSRINANLRKQVCVLIVDDQEFARNLHKLLLEREGARVTLASSGAEAIEKYKEYPSGYFNFIMMDVQMPGMDGFNAAKMIREFEQENERSSTYIYFVSGDYYDEIEMMAGLKTTFKISKVVQMDCLRKPIDIDAVKKIVENINKHKQ